VAAVSATALYPGRLRDATRLVRLKPADAPPPLTLADLDLTIRALEREARMLRRVRRDLLAAQALGAQEGL